MPGTGDTAGTAGTALVGAGALAEVAEVVTVAEVADAELRIHRHAALARVQHAAQVRQHRIQQLRGRRLAGRADALAPGDALEQSGSVHGVVPDRVSMDSRVCDQAFGASQESSASMPSGSKVQVIFS